MMHRPARSLRRRPGLEPLEIRSMLSTVATGPVPAISTAETSRIFVKFNALSSSSQESAALAAVGGSVTTVYPDGLDLIRLSGVVGANAAIKQLSRQSIVVYAEADATIRAEAVPVYPDEPAFPYQWALNNINNVDIDAPQAWSITTGNPAIIVAVLDSGLDLSNPDFSGHLWTNPTDDAAEGYPGDVHGWNFVGNNNNVADDNGHGTHVTSLLAAAGNNGVGVAGVAWNVQILPVKFLDATGVGTTDDAVSAIYYAVNHGARVINASWGGIDYTQPLDDAIAYANAHNVVFVTAAGNEGVDNDTTPSYPASIRLPNTLSVAAVDSNGQLPSFSNYGSATVDIAAPGVGILGDYPTSLSASGGQILSGTSMSTAYVSGVVALLAGLHPDYTAAQLVQRIDVTAKPLPSLTGLVISGGMVDAYSAIASSDTSEQATILSSDEFYAAHGSTPQGFVTGLYNDLLDRGSDPGGLAYWTGLIQSGTSSRLAVASAFLATPEAEATQVAHWYQDDLGRTASIDVLKTDPGVAGWVQLLAAGVTPETVEATILASPESQLDHGGTPTAVASGLYENLTGRAAEASGLTFWSGLLAAGTPPFSVVQAFQSSPEARATKVARWYTSYLGRSASLDTLKQDPGVVGFASFLLQT